jgi:hypothetical protein
MRLFQLIFVPLCAGASLLILSRGLYGRVPRRNALLWSLLFLAAAIAIALPSTTASVASWLGIGRGADLVFYLAILAGLAASVYFYSQNRRLEILITTLARSQALNAPARGNAAEAPTTSTSSHDH